MSRAEAVKAHRKHLFDAGLCRDCQAPRAKGVRCTPCGQAHSADERVRYEAAKQRQNVERRCSSCLADLGDKPWHVVYCSRECQALDEKALRWREIRQLATAGVR